jgi:predicted O-methyltransferase YrrM
MNPILAEMLATRTATAPDGSPIPLHSEISEAEGTLLQRLIRAQKPRITLEVGCGYGISTLYICEALADVGGEKHIVIDPEQQTDWQAAGLHAVERAGFGSLVEFHGQSSHVALPALEAARRRIGLALIDGWHTFDYAMVDFFYVDRLLDIDGTVVLDDTAAYPAVRKLARYIVEHRSYDVISNDPEAPALARRPPGASRSALSSIAGRLLRPDILRPDSALGLPPDNFIAFRKIADDARGNGGAGTRRWDQHYDF